jgi:oligopeptide transport system permease protein
MPEPHRPGQGHFVADLGETPLSEVDKLDESTPPLSLWADAWHHLRRRPIFIISALLIVLVLAVAIAPGLFTRTDPLSCDLHHGLDPSAPGHPFGYDRQGCDVYARVVYGARASVTVGFFTTAIVVILGAAIGALAGFYGRIWDSLLSRLTDIFFAIPLVLAAIVVMQVFRDRVTVWSVILVLSVFGWPQIARITRGAVMAVKNADYVTAAKALGTTKFRTLLRHVLPNAAAPIIVVATVSLGIFIVTEATLSFLGIGLNASRIVSWGADISYASATIRTNPSVLFYPAGALALTVLSFIMLGDAVRDALDPKARQR